MGFKRIDNKALTEEQDTLYEFLQILRYIPMWAEDLQTAKLTENDIDKVMEEFNEKCGDESLEEVFNSFREYDGVYSTVFSELLCKYNGED